MVLLSFHRGAEFPPHCVLYWIFALFSLESVQGTLDRQLLSKISKSLEWGVFQDTLPHRRCLWFELHHISSVLFAVFSEVSLIPEDVSTMQQVCCLSLFLSLWNLPIYLHFSLCQKKPPLGYTQRAQVSEVSNSGFHTFKVMVMAIPEASFLSLLVTGPERQENIVFYRRSHNAAWSCQ